MRAIVNIPICPLLDRPGPVGGDYPTVVDEALYGMVVELLERPAPGWRGVRTHYRYEGVVREADLIPGDAEAARLGGPAQADGVAQELLRCPHRPQGPGVSPGHPAPGRGGVSHRGGGEGLAARPPGGRPDRLCSGRHFGSLLHRPQRGGGRGAPPPPDGDRPAVPGDSLPLGRQKPHGHRLLRAGVHGLSPQRHRHLP